MIEIYIIKLCDAKTLASSQIEPLLDLLPQEQKVKYSGKSINLVQMSSLIAAATVQKTAKEKLGNTTPITISYAEQGKPFFKDFPNFQFNISHSKEFVCVAVSSQAIGVDIEKNRRCKEEIVRRFLHPQEESDILSVELGEARNRYFTQVWSLKESYVKYNGKGISNQFKDFFVQIQENGEVKSSLDLEGVRFFPFTCFEDYQLSVCTNSEWEQIPFFLTKLKKDFLADLNSFQLCE